MGPTAAAHEIAAERSRQGSPPLRAAFQTAGHGQRQAADSMSHDHQHDVFHIFIECRNTYIPVLDMHNPVRDA
jgi:hypothetical protein